MKRALIIAIGSGYPDPYKLRDSLNDKDDLTATLAAKGFAVTSIIDAQATRANVLAGYRSMVSNANPGDSIVLAFFGHGSWFNGPYGVAQCICPVDVFQGGLIADYELAGILAGLKPGTTCDFINGACFSGTSTRALAAQSGSKQFTKLFVHQIPGPLKPSKKIALLKAAVPVPGMKESAWNACRKDQLSYGGLSGGKYRGVYPLYLCWALRAYPTYTRAQIDAIVSQYVKAAVTGQDPQLEGTPAELAQLPFS